ncbi:hypothetical protein HZC00_05695 [Candidatus Kaiserbacteria bacterium]|nr:hypothetical protein [Candidatus Kaiserbacteria bacterium]
MREVISDTEEAVMSDDQAFGKDAKKFLRLQLSSRAVWAAQQMFGYVVSPDMRAFVEEVLVAYNINLDHHGQGRELLVSSKGGPFVPAALWKPESMISFPPEADECPEKTILITDTKRVRALFGHFMPIARVQSMEAYANNAMFAYYLLAQHHMRDDTFCRRVPGSKELVFVTLFAYKGAKDGT